MSNDFFTNHFCFNDTGRKENFFITLCVRVVMAMCKISHREKENAKKRERRENSLFILCVSLCVKSNL